MKSTKPAQFTMPATPVDLSGVGATPARGSSAPSHQLWALVCLMVALLAPASAKPGIAAEITISGNVFYNDNRTAGHFSLRSSPTGTVGKKGDRELPNWLGAYRWTVDIIELDKSEPEGSRGCTKSQLVTTVAVGSDGRFSATIKAKDRCKYNVAQILDLQLRAKMHNCFGDWCISFRDADGEIYGMDLDGATYARPLKAVAGRSYDLGDQYYPARDGSNNTATINGVASNYWASVIDGAIFLHEEVGIPSFQDEFGALSYYYPSSESGTATALSPHKVAISPYKFEGLLPAWIPGKTPVHEYGHILMQRAWGGGYGFPGTGRSANDYERASSPAAQVAFKEAWAEFVARVVFSDAYGCEGEEFDLNNHKTFDRFRDEQEKEAFLLLTDRRRAELGGMEKEDRAEEGFDIFGPILAPWLQGVEYRYNNLKFLCDFYDSTPISDNVKDPSEVTPGARGSTKPRTLQGSLGSPRPVNERGPFAEPLQYPSLDRREDRLNVSMLDMWTILRGMFLRHNEYGGKFVDPGLYVCDWAGYYVNLINSEEAIGDEAHEVVAKKVRDLVSLNNMSCSGVFGTAATPVR